MINNPHPHWKIPQWVAYIKNKDIPVMPPTVEKIKNLYQENSFNLEPKIIANIALEDPFFSLRLLIKSEKRIKTSLNSETKTILGSILHLGMKEVVNDVLIAPQCLESEGLTSCEQRAVKSAKISASWASLRIDVCPEEIALASLLADLGELMLWLFAPELPSMAQDEVLSGRTPRNKDAQQKLFNFGFKELSLVLAEEWHLPLPVKQLIKGTDTLRAKISKTAVEVSRHLNAKEGYKALPDDILIVRELIPHAKYTDIIFPLNLNDEIKQFIFEKISIGT